MKIIKVLELFAGYGSQALALENLGLEFTSDISEIDKYAIEAYNQIHGQTKNYGDICNIDEAELTEYDLVTYSSPCQDFSLAGKMRGGEKGSGTRSSLLWECERIIRAVKPKYLLMENVKNLVGKKFMPCFKAWLLTLEGMGYNNYWKVLNAKDYGVPQNRERVFVVSIRKDFNQTYMFPEPMPLKIHLKDVLETEVDEKFYLSEAFLKYMKQKEEKNYNFRVEVSDENGIRKTPIRGQGDKAVIKIKANTKKGYDIAKEGDTINIEQPKSTTRRGRIGKGKAQTLTTSCNQVVVEIGVGHNPVSKKFEFDGFHDDKECPTLLATDYKAPKCYSDGIRIRKLTPRECWRLMGVRDEQFDRLHGISKTQLYKMAGNSIVVDVLMAIFKNLLVSDKETKGQLELL